MNLNIADRLRVGSESRELKLGKSFTNGGSSTFHSVRYDFKPASVDTTKMATVEVKERHEVTVTVPHIEGSGTAHTVFKGSQKPYQKECVLIVDNITGEITLERLSYNIQLKKTRAEGSSRIQPRPITPIDSGSKKYSPSQKQPSPSQKAPHSPNQKVSSWSSGNNHNSPSQKNLLPQPSHLQQPRISPSQKSPTNQPSPSMPTLMPSSNSRPPSTGRDSTLLSMPTNESADINDGPNIGVLSDSSDSSSNDSSSSSDSSDSEEEKQGQRHKSTSKPFSGGAVNGLNGQHSQNSYAMPRVNHLSQLSEDLQLSSDSESDGDD